MKRATALACVIAMSGALACQQAEGSGSAEALSTASPALELFGGAESEEALARLVVEAIGRRDTSVLEVLRLTEHEHNEQVFPRLPAGQPPQNFPVDIAWANIRTRNSVAVLSLFERFGGEELAFRDLECRGATEVFDGFEVATDCRVEFEDADGVRHEEQLFRHVLHGDGQYKVFRYYD